MSFKTVQRFQFDQPVPANAVFLFHDKDHGWPLVYEVPEKVTKTVAKADGVDEIQEIISGVVAYLNKVTGAKYTTKAKATVTPIRARINEGRTLDDFINVINKKYAEWGEDPTWSKYLRPETLFGTKFDGYLAQKVEGLGEDLFEELDGYLENIK